ncbi:MAG: thioredoxin family protein [Deltaproteobacteria bacterium]|nr:thioredoxin family protein [Deltaproteobacteria bacterium]
MIEKLKSKISDIHSVEVDLTQHPEIAVRYRIMSTPAIAINGKLEFTGMPKENDFLERVAKYIQP